MLYYFTNVLMMKRFPAREYTQERQVKSMTMSLESILLSWYPSSEMLTNLCQAVEYQDSRPGLYQHSRIVALDIATLL